MQHVMPLEQSIKELEFRVAHHKGYRKAMMEEALNMSSSNPRKAFLMERCAQWAKTIGRLENSLYELYAQRASC